MNKLSKDKYAELTALAANLNVSMAALHEKCARMRTHRGTLKTRGR